MIAADSKAAADSIPGALRKHPPVAWKEIAEPVEPFLEAVAVRLARQVREFDPGIAAYAEYALTGQGKQLRPALVALSARAIGPVGDAHVTVAVIIEMVHLATLVHDDVMDEAEIRRGRLTVGANWGNEIAVLFGDCLFAHALKLAAGFPTPEICRAVATATNTVCTGEILQTRNRRNFELPQAEYFRFLEMKTAELFALSCELGGCLAGAPLTERAGLRAFGLALGTAYQIYDDCLDLFGTEAAAGKSLGTDLAKGKLTLPMLLLWERADASSRAELQGWIAHWQPAAVPALRGLLDRHDALGASLLVVERYLDQARQALHALPAGANLTGLLSLADFLAQQTAALAGRA